VSEPSIPERAARTRERIQGLAALGARTFAPSALAFAEGLIARGEGLGGTAGARLIARAEARAEALARELEDARGRARAALDGAGDAAGDLARAIEAGDFGRVLRAERRLRVAAMPPVAGLEAWRARLSAEASARGLRLGNELHAPGALASALYASSRAELSATLVALRAQADVPLHAGPYNPLAIAARALAELSSLAPSYLTAIVAYLDELSPLLTLPPAASRAAERPHAPPGARARRKASTRPPR
jgi:hypothetical protein